MPKSQKPRKRHNVWKTAHQDLSKRPHIHQAYQTFTPIYGLLSTLNSGHIEVADGRPIMTIWGGDQCEVGPALEGWISCWDRIINGERLPIDLESLRYLHWSLMSGHLLTVEMIAAAKQVTDQCYAAYTTLPRSVIISYSRTEQIAIELDELGLITESDESTAATEGQK
jgi:hypothetical protein